MVDHEEDSDEEFYEGRVFQRKECDISIEVGSSYEESDGEGRQAGGVFGFRSYSFFDRRNEIATLQSWIMYPDWISKEGIVGNGVPVSP